MLILSGGVVGLLLTPAPVPAPAKSTDLAIIRATTRFETGRVKSVGSPQRIQGSAGSLSLGFGPWRLLATGRALSTQALTQNGAPLGSKIWRVSGGAAAGWCSTYLSAALGPAYRRESPSWTAWARIGPSDGLQLVAGKDAPGVEPIPGQHWVALAVPLGDGRLTAGWARGVFDRDTVSVGAWSPIGSGWRLSVGAGVSPSGASEALTLTGGFVYAPSRAPALALDEKKEKNAPTSTSQGRSTPAQKKLGEPGKPEKPGAQRGRSKFDGLGTDPWRPSKR